MISKPTTNWETTLSKKLSELLTQPSVRYTTLTPSLIPEVAGVYLITKLENQSETPLYIGRTKNMRQRLYQNHLMGQISNARLKKYLIDDNVCKNVAEAKEYMRAYCAVRWIEEVNFRNRGAIEAYCTAVLFPKYGIEEEH